MDSTFFGPHNAPTSATTFLRPRSRFSGIPRVKFGKSDDRESPARKSTAVSVDFIDDGCVRVAQFVASRFFGRIGRLQRAFLDPTLARKRRESRFEAEHIGKILGHVKDSLWSCDLFRCESATLRKHWVLVVMDQFTRRLIGFGIHSGIMDGLALCRMFHRAIRGHCLPRYLSSDHDPLYRFHLWQAHLRVLALAEIKTVPYVPLSHPFVERLIGTVQREYLDRILFWTASDLETKLLDFRHY